MSTRILGVRHHGPGSARSTLAALTEWQPDVVLVEGPPEGDALLPWLASASMVPPVALLVYVPDEPRRAVCYPFARFSPEWQALRYAVARGIPARFIDLPQTHWLAFSEEEKQRTPIDPIRMLAEAAGSSDSERWWEHMVEHRRDSTDVFQAVMEAMTALRETSNAEPDPLEQKREAHMRQMIRAAEKDGFEKIAVVCGAWHAPALEQLPAAKQDAALLKGLPTVKVQATWVPWTHGRLQWVSGYGAGIDSPGWYDHLWQHRDQIAARWLASVAALLREQDMDASPAQLIDSVRLADALAAMRRLPLPGLGELMESVETVLLFGNRAPLQLIHDKLIVGETLGQVPDETPAVPLQQDLTALQKRLRMPAEAGQKVLDLDLRKPMDRDRSLLLHRLRLLDIHWGEPERVTGKAGTFHEVWRIAWRPELAVDVIAAAIWGNTVELAAGARVRDQAVKLGTLPELTSLLEGALKAALADAIPDLIRRLRTESAIAPDLAHLMRALPALARVTRYGDVRETATSLVGEIVRGMLARVCVGLPVSAGSLDDAAAETMRQDIRHTDEAVNLLEMPEERGTWRGVLLRVADLPGVHGLVSGTCCRILFDSGELPAAEVARRMQLALSVGADPAQGALWLEGLLQGSGLILLHDDALWRLVDDWVICLKPDTFVATLPLLARTFSSFPAAERRQMGERIRAGALATNMHTEQSTEFDQATADAVLPLLAQLLGIKETGV